MTPENLDDLRRLWPGDVVSASKIVKKYQGMRGYVFSGAMYQDDIVALLDVVAEDHERMDYDIWISCDEQPGGVWVCSTPEGVTHIRMLLNMRGVVIRG